MHQCTTSYFSNKSNNRTFSPLLHFTLFCNTCCKCNEGWKFKSYPYSTIFRDLSFFVNCPNGPLFMLVINTIIMFCPILTISYKLGIKFQAYLHTGYRWSHSVLHFYIWQPVVASTRLEDKKYEELTYCVIKRSNTTFVWDVKTSVYTYMDSLYVLNDVIT